MASPPQTSPPAVRRPDAARSPAVAVLVGALFCGGMYALSRYNYLFFHSVAEGFATVVASAVFLLVWNARNVIQNDYLKFIGVAYAFVAFLEFIHMLSFKGMNVLGELSSAGTGAQFWLAARGLEAASLIAAPFFLRRVLNLALMLVIYGVLTAGLTWLIFAGHAPTAYVEGVGLTAFKITSEYMICAGLLLSAVLLYRSRALLHPDSLRLMMLATALTIASELAFTIYVDVDGIANTVGHILLVLSFFFVYRATIQIGLTQPYASLFRDLQQQGLLLSKSHDTLSELVLERTHALEASNKKLLAEIQEHKRTEMQLRQAQKMEAIGQLAGGIAHDFNNFLTVILGYSNILLTTLRDEEAIESITEIRNAGERAARLTRQLLTFSRNKHTLQLHPLDLAEVISNIRPMLASILGDMCALSLSLSATPKVLLDPTFVEQIVVNLAVNAKDAMPTGGHLSLTLSPQTLPNQNPYNVPPADYAHLSVQDSGCGMSPDTIERIFEPFFTTKGPDKGTGLGLSTVYGIVQQANGHIRVDSAPGAGTTFHIFLPVLDADLAPETFQPPVQPPKPGQGTILLVEDNDGVRNLLAHVLSSNGYKVIRAASAEEALKLLSESPAISLLLSDINLPNMDGRALAVELTRRSPQTRVIFMSGSFDGDFPDLPNLPQQSVTALSKPIPPGELLSAIHATLQIPLKPSPPLM